mgnify:CR=1 FL=1
MSPLAGGILKTYLLLFPDGPDNLVQKGGVHWNCIFDLHQDFVDDSPLDPAWMFPGVSEDPFYKKLIEIKDSAPTLLPNLVEYEWARTT